MKVIVHHPQTLENLHDLQKKAATIHAEAVLRYIQKIPCPKEQKLKMTNDLIKKDSQ